MSKQLQNQNTKDIGKSENYSIGTDFGAASALPTSFLWVADFIGAALLTGASWPAVLSISSSKLSAAIIASFYSPLNTQAPVLKITCNTLDNFSELKGIFLPTLSGQSNSNS